VHRLLKEKDTLAPEEGTNWSTSEALESSGLQESGTYRKALWRRIQNAVVPILSELIAYMDRDGNLELLETGIPWLTELWIKIFNDEELTQLNYESFFVTDDDRQVRSHVPVTSSGRDAHFFQCRFPFSWLLKEKIDSMWTQAKGVAGQIAFSFLYDYYCSAMVAFVHFMSSALFSNICRRFVSVQCHSFVFSFISYLCSVSGSEILTTIMIKK
jgi:hypothetical protein